MPRGKEGKANRAFIKPGEGKKFRLVNRSVRDLAGYAPGAGQHVLAPIGETAEDLSIEEMKELERTNGIEFDDNYNYMQHLRERSREAVVWESADQQSQFSLASGMSGMSRASRRSRFSTMSKLSRVSNPSQVGVLFESDMELPDNHFQELAAEQYELNLDVDPEVAAHLEDQDCDDIVVDPEDDECDMFDEMIQQAREQGSDDEFDEMHGTGETIGASDPAIVWQRFLESTGAYAGDDSQVTHERRTMEEEEELYDDFDSDNEAQFSDDEDDGQTRFTAYSMTSSIMRRNQNLQNLDENFEGYFAQFDDEELGDMPQKDLDQNEIDHDSKLLENAIQADYKEFKGEVRYGEGVHNMIDLAKKLNMAEDVRRYMANRGDSDSDEEMPELVEVEAKPKWDCESIISTYSNLYNRPKVVDDDGFSVKSKLKPKRGNRKVMFGSALKELEDKYQEERSEMKAPAPQARNKSETKEDKKRRKQLVKEGKRERREEKKETKMAFAREFSQAAKRDKGNSVKLH
jgi:protein LTV1